MLEILYEEDTPDFVISDRAQQILRDQEIDVDGPGTALTDFETLLQFIGNAGLNTTSKYYLLPQSKLDELNQQMSRPVMHRLKRPQQRSFPHLHGLYLMLRASGMAVGEGVSEGVGEGVSRVVGKGVGEGVSEGVSRAVGEGVDGGAGGRGDGRGACEGAQGGIGTMELGLVDPEWMRGCADQIRQALTVGCQIMLGTTIITHIQCRWFGPICEGGWG